MIIGSSLFGPPSKYDHSLAYTYLARVYLVEGADDIAVAYFADTICGLIDRLEESSISPGDVQLFGLYIEREIPLEVRYCTDENGRWLSRPELCHSLEQHYKVTLELAYRGHRAEEPCDFVDRDRTAHGPF